ncbi:MAG: hypothetical protein ABIZ04_15450 [Opitutus sp.]
MHRHVELIGLGFAACLVLGSIGRFWVPGLATERQRVVSRAIRSDTAPYVPAARTVRESPFGSWRPPVPQPNDRAWTYDLFTPPEIYYDPSSKRFTVTPPTLSLPNEPAPAPTDAVDFRLLSVNRSLFPLQLIGFVGTGPEAVGVFENSTTGETVIGRAGQSIPSMNLFIETFATVPTPIALPDSMTTHQVIATARVKNVITGEVTPLTSKERHYAPKLSALIAAGPDDLIRQNAVEGDVFVANGISYAAETVQLTPPSITVAWRLSESGAEQHRTVVAAGIPAGDWAAADQSTHHEERR